MERTERVMSILLYFFLPEDSTKASDTVYLNSVRTQNGRRSWMEPLKAVFWAVVAVAGPLVILP